MSVAEWAIPLLGCAALLYTLPTLRNGVKIKHYILIVIAILTLGFTWWNTWIDSDKIDILTSNSDSLITSNNSIKDTLNSVNKTIAELGLRFDEKTDKILVTDSQLLKRSILKIVNHNESFFYPSYIPNTSPDNNIEQRHLTDSMIIKIKYIPKDYVVNILYNPDKETAALTKELKTKLSSLGYKINEIGTSMMGPVPKQYEFMVTIDTAKKSAEIDIAQQAFYMK